MASTRGRGRGAGERGGRGFSAPRGPSGFRGNRNSPRPDNAITSNTPSALRGRGGDRGGRGPPRGGANMRGRSMSPRGHGRGRGGNHMPKTFSHATSIPPSKSNSMSNTTPYDQDDYQQRFDYLKNDQKDKFITFVQQGLMNPAEKMNLKDAVDLRGICREMCPEYERVRRIVEKDLKVPEYTPESLLSGKRSDRVPDESRMVKQYQRSAAGNEAELVSDIRSPSACLKSMKYMMNRLDSEDLEDLQGFIWDRTRAVRKDLRIQVIDNEEEFEISLECFELNARYHLISLHYMARSMNDFYSYQQDFEQLNSTNIDLKEAYLRARSPTFWEAPNEAEFQCYRVILALHTKERLIEYQFYLAAPHLRTNLRVHTAFQILRAGKKIFAQERRPAVAQQNWRGFWNLIRSPSVSYLMACAAEVAFQEIRCIVLDGICRIYRQQGRSMQDLEISTVCEMLGFDSEDEAIEFCEQHGLYFEVRDSGETFLDIKPNTRLVSPESLKPQLFSSIVESKRFDRSLSAVIQGMSVSEARTNDLIVESELTENIETDPEVEVRLNIDDAPEDDYPEDEIREARREAAFVVKHYGRPAWMNKPSERKAKLYPSANSFQMDSASTSQPAEAASQPAQAAPPAPSMSNPFQRGPQNPFKEGYTLPPRSSFGLPSGSGPETTSQTSATPTAFPAYPSVIPAESQSIPPGTFDPLKNSIKFSSGTEATSQSPFTATARAESFNSPFTATAKIEPSKSPFTATAKAEPFKSPFTAFTATGKAEPFKSPTSSSPFLPSSQGRSLNAPTAGDIATKPPHFQSFITTSAASSVPASAPGSFFSSITNQAPLPSGPPAFPFFENAAPLSASSGGPPAALGPITAPDNQAIDDLIYEVAQERKAQDEQQRRDREEKEREAHEESERKAKEEKQRLARQEEQRLREERERRLQEEQQRRAQEEQQRLAEEKRQKKLLAKAREDQLNAAFAALTENVFLEPAEGLLAQFIEQQVRTLLPSVKADVEQEKADKLADELYEHRRQAKLRRFCAHWKDKVVRKKRAEKARGRRQWLKEHAAEILAAREEGPAGNWAEGQVNIRRSNEFKKPAAPASAGRVEKRSKSPVKKDKGKAPVRAPPIVRAVPDVPISNGEPSRQRNHKRSHTVANGYSAQPYKDPTAPIDQTETDWFKLRAMGIDPSRYRKRSHDESSEEEDEEASDRKRMRTSTSSHRRTPSRASIHSLGDDDIYSRFHRLRAGKSVLKKFPKAAISQSTRGTLSATDDLVARAKALLSATSTPKQSPPNAQHDFGRSAPDLGLHNSSGSITAFRQSNGTPVPPERPAYWGRKSRFVPQHLYGKGPEAISAYFRQSRGTTASSDTGSIKSLQSSSPPAVHQSYHSPQEEEYTDDEIEEDRDGDEEMSDEEGYDQGVEGEEEEEVLYDEEEEDEQHNNLFDEEDEIYDEEEEYEDDYGFTYPSQQNAQIISGPGATQDDAIELSD